MSAASNAVMTRGGGPVIGNLSGNLTLGATNAAYNLSYGAIGGTLWFDNDADGDLSPYWHFNHATGVVAGRNDFYSVALHEILHTMGFGVGTLGKPMSAARRGLALTPLRKMAPAPT